MPCGSPHFSKFPWIPVIFFSLRRGDGLLIKFKLYTPSSLYLPWGPILPQYFSLFDVVWFSMDGDIVLDFLQGSPLFKAVTVLRDHELPNILCLCVFWWEGGVV